MVAQFRLARITDARAIAEIHAASWWETYRGMLPRTYLDALRPDRLETHWRGRLQRERASQSIWVIEDRRGVGGFSVIGGCRSDAELAGFAGEVYMLYLRPERLGHGLGRVLLEQSLAEIERRGYYWVVIWVVKANRNAQAFYRHVGLRNDGAFRWDEFHGRKVGVVRYATPLNLAVPNISSLRTPLAGKIE